MPRSRNDAEYAGTVEIIKRLARQRMAAEGTAAISLRAIARELGLTAPALYRYFPSRDHLITALIVDAFNGLAEALANADAACRSAHYRERLRSVLLAYRRWAIEQPTDFILIYGNPIPGYEAPRELTVPAASRSMTIVLGLLSEAHAAGMLAVPPHYTQVPASISEAMAQSLGLDDSAAQRAIAAIGMTGWAHIHGLIMLELFDHSPGVVGDAEAFYVYEIDNLIERLGFAPHR